MSFPHHRWSRPGEVWGAASGQGTDEALAIQTSVPLPSHETCEGRGLCPGRPVAALPTIIGTAGRQSYTGLLQHRPGAAVTQGAGSRSSRAGARCRRSPVCRPWSRR